MWKSFVDCADYEVSDAGEVRRVVRSLPRGRAVPYLLGQRIGNSGYRHVSLSFGGKARNVLVHRMVLRTFVGEPPTPEHHGAHIDGTKLNNALANLVWATPGANAAHKRDHGTAFNPRSLNRESVVEMRSIYRDDDVSYRSLGERFGVSAATAHGIVTGRYWPHVPGATTSKSKGRRTTANVPPRRPYVDT